MKIKLLILCTILFFFDCKKTEKCTGIAGGTPSIKFTSWPKIGSEGSVNGSVSGDNIQNYDIAVYIQVGNGFWTKPFFNSPITNFDKCGFFTADVTTGNGDIDATEIIAFLIPTSYSPPILAGDPIPIDLEQNAIAQISITR